MAHPLEQKILIEFLKLNPANTSDLALRLNVGESLVIEAMDSLETRNPDVIKKKTETGNGSIIYSLDREEISIALNGSQQLR